MKAIKRITAILLVFVLCCSAMCISAFAAPAENELTPMATSYTATSTYASIVGSSGTGYYIAYSNSAYAVGYGYTNATKAVKVAQARCYLAGTLSSVSGIDGLFGNNTYSAICGFQGKYGLSVDGVVGVGTWRSMLYTHKNANLVYYL